MQRLYLKWSCFRASRENRTTRKTQYLAAAGALRAGNHTPKQKYLAAAGLWSLRLEWQSPMINILTAEMLKAEQLNKTTPPQNIQLGRDDYAAGRAAIEKVDVQSARIKVRDHK